MNNQTYSFEPCLKIVFSTMRKDTLIGADEADVHQGNIRNVCNKLSLDLSG